VKGETGAIEPVELAIPLVAESLEKYARGEGISLVAFKDFPTKLRRAFSCLSRWGYARIAGFPPVILELNFASFDEYMAVQLSRATRKNLRRKFRAADDASPPLALEVWTDAGAIIDEIYPLYLAVAQTSAIRFEGFQPANIFSKQGDARREDSAISFGDKVVAQSPLVSARFGMEHSTITILVWITRSRTS
jgi:hypothetical protein